MHYVAEDALLILLLLLPKYGDYGFALYHLIHGLLGIESITLCMVGKSSATWAAISAQGLFLNKLSCNYLVKPGPSDHFWALIGHFYSPLPSMSQFKTLARTYSWKRAKGRQAKALGCVWRRRLFPDFNTMPRFVRSCQHSPREPGWSNLVLHTAIVPGTSWE